jgi:hypothetical protein
MLGDGSCGLRSSAASGATLGERWSFSPTKSWERWTCWRPYRRQGGLDDPDAAITSVHERRKKEIQEKRKKKRRTEKKRKNKEKRKEKNGKEKKERKEGEKREGKTEKKTED